MKDKLSVRELSFENIENIVDYFLNSNKEFLIGMGADPNKLPARETWLSYMIDEFTKDYVNKSIYYIIWHIDQQPIGHCNINDITFGKEAYMHLHMWNQEHRNKGLGAEFVKQSIPYFFKNFNLKTLYCRPFSLNPAPNSTLVKLGFDFVETYETIPGRISFKQKVNLYTFTKEKLNQL